MAPFQQINTEDFESLVKLMTAGGIPSCSYNWKCLTTQLIMNGWIQWDTKFNLLLRECFWKIGGKHFSLLNAAECVVKYYTFFLKRVMQRNVCLFLPLCFLSSLPSSLSSYLYTCLSTYPPTNIYYMPTMCQAHVRGTKIKKDAVLPWVAIVRKIK